MMGYHQIGYLKMCNQDNVKNIYYEYKSMDSKFENGTNNCNKFLYTYIW